MKKKALSRLVSVLLRMYWYIQDAHVLIEPNIIPVSFKGEVLNKKKLVKAKYL